MAGFGNGPFGSGPFGRADYSRLVLHGSVPPRMREEDLAAEGIFESVLNMAEFGLDHLLNKLAEFPRLRHPGFVKTKFTQTEDINVVSATIVTALQDPEWGPYVSLNLATAPVDIGEYWQASKDGIDYTVLRVRKQELRIDVVGASSPGTGTMTFNCPEQMTTFYKDFALAPDRHFDDTYLRGELEHAIQWMNLKGSLAGYIQRGQISGYGIEVFQLWAVDAGTVGMLDPSEYFEFPIGSGEFLTTVEPIFPVFDDVALDMIPLDTPCREFTSGELDFARNIATVIPSTDSPLTGSSLHTITIDAEVEAIGLLGRWVITDSNGNLFVLEQQNSPTEFTVAGMILPVIGPATVTYECGKVEDCSWCPTHYLRLIVTPTPELLAAFPGESGKAIVRMIEKLLQATPIHVVFAQIIEIHETTVIINMAVTGDTASSHSVQVGGHHFDVTPLDVIELDENEPMVTDTFP